jgi:hypothetical protein
LRYYLKYDLKGVRPVAQIMQDEGFEMNEYDTNALIYATCRAGKLAEMTALRDQLFESPSVQRCVKSARTFVRGFLRIHSPEEVISTLGRTADATVVLACLPPGLQLQLLREVGSSPLATPEMVAEILTVVLETDGKDEKELLRLMGGPGDLSHTLLMNAVVSPVHCFSNKGVRELLRLLVERGEREVLVSWFRRDVFLCETAYFETAIRFLSQQTGAEKTLLDVYGLMTDGDLPPSESIFLRAFRAAVCLEDSTRARAVVSYAVQCDCLPYLQKAMKTEKERKILEHFRDWMSEREREEVLREVVQEERTHVLREGEPRHVGS